MSITVHEICKGMPKLDASGRTNIVKAKKGELGTVADGLTPKRPPVKEGLHTFTPEELLTLVVPVVEVNSRVVGYQRPFDRLHARRIARKLEKGSPFPDIQVALDGHGAMYAVDGQHRAVGAVIARKNLDGIVKRMSKDEQRELFAGQRFAKKVDRNVLILDGTGPFERYIQAACTSNTHPWSSIVSAHSSSKTRITPYAMLDLLTSYVGNAAVTAISEVIEKRWDERLADEMAPLIACFGNKQTNPLAFRPAAIRGVGRAAMHVFRRNEKLQTGDRERWMEKMPQFAWERYLHVRSAGDFGFHLVAHWNKRLHASRKVKLD